MSGPALNTVLQQLRGLVRPPDGGLTDAQLLARWLANRDEAAFELLVWRHGPSVLGVCQRLLRAAQDIEDAFQATFLIFLRKAATIGKHEAVGSWLYKVAYRVALQARLRSSRQQLLDGRDVLIPAPATADAVAWRDVRLVVDDEVSRLPVRWRTVFVLCCLQGKTNEEAARELGVPTGTVLSRLSRARARLRSRLTRRGVTLTTGLLGAGLAAEASASVPVTLVNCAMRAALLGAAQQAAAAGLVTAQAAALTKGALHAMWLTKVQTTAAVVLSVALVGGGSVFTYRTLAAGPSDGPNQGVKADDSPTQANGKNKPDGVNLKRRKADGAENQSLSALLDKTEARAQLFQDEARRERDLNARYRDEIAMLNKRVKDLEDALQQARRQARNVQDNMTRGVDDPGARHKTPTPDQRRFRTNAIQPSGNMAQETAPSAAQSFPQQLANRGKPRPDVVPGRIEEAKDAVEIAQAQLQAKRADLASVGADLDAARKTLARLTKLHETGAVTNELLDEAKAKEAKVTALAMVKKAELQEQEIRLRQATHRLDRLQAGWQAQLEHAAAHRAPRAAQEARPGASPSVDHNELREIRETLQRLQRQLDRLERAAPPPAGNAPER